MKFEEILRDLKNKIYKPVYFLHGEEEYFIDIITDYIAENVLEESDREFNQNILYGKDVDVGTIIDTARRYPMMSNYQVVIVKEAQVIKNIDELASYFEKPVESTILVVCHKHKAYDNRKVLAKRAGNVGVNFASNRLFENKIPAWINDQLKAEGYSISPGGARLLTASLGVDLSKIRNELGKLILNLKPGQVIDEDIIEQNIGISKDFNIFELQKAMGEGNMYKANLICRHFAANPKSNPFILTTTLLYQFFIKILIFHSLKDKSNNQSVGAALGMHHFFVKEYRTAARKFSPAKVFNCISLLREYDLKFKGVNNNSTVEGELLKEMVFRMMH